MKHNLFHILGCLIPIALIFILPALGVGQGVTFTLFIVLMFACHLFMMGGHNAHKSQATASSSDPHDHEKSENS